MKKHTLQVSKRDVSKEKPAHLRREGLIPGTVYGKHVDSESLSMKLADFVKVYGEARETGLVDLVINGSSRPVLIHHVQKDPVRESVLHVEFHQVDLKEKVHANIPLVLVGESPAVAQKKGVVLSLLSEIEVEALPADLPEKLEVDISTLSEVEQELKVSDIQVPAAVAVLTDAAVIVARVGELVSKAAEEQAAADAAVADAASAETAEGGSAAEAGAETATADTKPDEEKKSDDK